MNKSDMLKEKKAAIKEYVKMQHKGNMADYYKKKYDILKESLYEASVVCSDLEGYIKAMDNKTTQNDHDIINKMVDTVRDLKDRIEEMVTE
jgi:hypothetical protein